jgi:O-antigen/teichoic acid export membrane protein
VRRRLESGLLHAPRGAALLSAGTTPLYASIVSPQSQPDRSNASAGAIAALLSRGSVYTAATAAQLSAGVLVLPFLTRLLPPGEMGLVALAVVVQSVLAVVGAAGFPAVITRTYFRGVEGPQRARLLLRRCFLGAVLIAAIADLTEPLWSGPFTGPGHGLGLRLAVWSAVPVAMITCSQSVLRAEDRAGRYVVTAVGSTAVAQALGVAIVASTEPEAPAYILGLLVGQAATAILAVRWVGVGSSSPASSTGLTREALRIGLPTVTHSLAIYILAAGDRVLIQASEGLGEVGRYQIAYQIGALGLVIIAAFNNAWDPIVFAESEERRWRTLADTRAVLYRVAGMLTAALAVGAPVALVVAAPPRYDPSGLVAVSSIVALSAVPTVSYMASYHVLLWEGRTGVMAWATPVAAGVNIALNLVLIPTFGLEGAAVATVLAYTLLATLYGRAARSLVRVPGGVRPLITAMAWAAIGAAASLILPAEGVWLVLRTAAALLIGLAVLRYGASLVRGATGRS